MEQIANSNAVARSEYDAVKVLPKEPKGLASGTPAFEHDIKALIINGDTVDIRVDKEGRVNLNDLHNASPYKGTQKKAVREFMRRVKTSKLINSLESTVGIPTVQKFEGNTEMTGTWVHPDIALAYSAWVDNDFYVNVAKTFGNVVRGDMVKVKEVVRTAVRQEGVPVHAQESITRDCCRKLLKRSLSEVAYRREKRER
ncbi:KilA-N domain-containing protein [Salmonella enterica subsp. enterica]|nr:KilA-N domain-containing protein [Salmonella enterica subsp. enterica]